AGRSGGTQRAAGAARGVLLGEDILHVGRGAAATGRGRPGAGAGGATLPVSGEGDPGDLREVPAGERDRVGAGRAGEPGGVAVHGCATAEDFAGEPRAELF